MMDWLWLLPAMFLIGALHALEPGHGKLLVTSYLSGSQSRMRDAVLLGLFAAGFHMLSVTLIGTLIFILAFAFFKDAYLNWIQVLSGSVILCLGSFLIWKRFIHKAASAHDDCGCHHDHTPAESVANTRPRSSLKEVFFIGFASGINPCPPALVALVAAFSMGKVLSALGALTIFSLGFGSVLLVLGILLIRGSQSLPFKLNRFPNAPLVMARVSAVLVLLLGVYLVIKPFAFPETSASHEAMHQAFELPVAFDLNMSRLLGLE